jgi:hypothetical protein
MSDENNAIFDSQASADATNLDQGVSEATEAEELLSGDENSEEAIQSEDKQQKDPWYKRRIDELTRDKHEARRQAERLEKILEQQEAMLRQNMPQNAPEAARGPVPPNPNDFAGGQFDPRYMDAMLHYTRESAVIEARQAVAQEYEQRQAEQMFYAAQAKLETGEAAARAKYADYDAVIDPITADPRLAQNPTIRQAVLGLENGPDIAYVLGRNLDVAYEIASMHPIQAGMKLAELMNRAPRKTSNAPNPIHPLNGAATSSPRGSKNYAEMTTAEYIAARNAEERSRKESRIKR